ncbi:filamin-like isoform X1 [Neodiprion pinetum]|uniref:Filamin-A isoform X1 n=2 Tax=Neodiprion lecontei TaxID=441921 RepID=A0A6J0B523_NEOLC|nr:filamin-A isoform X1 [Neodiprion lecontei]XP_046485392.1 filamin-A isoform X1 [Neodiprion pinetum]XP_046485393.1 filamin-A isoform X1 [Neodiprion pinetum]XP_046485394.1 filamin-A isoform X1 [Neodiprion pinetum]XP_046597935.1 filamin-A isoform X1 [Neodiprion lecontei]XP_046597936.1 filamin-A isoform X1 [Neodiprion lecontei]
MNNNDKSVESGNSAEEEDEMIATERELAEDAKWKRIQQNTFTRWANEHLKCASKTIGDLETDLSDGLRLVTLIEVLSQKKLPKHNKRPNFRSQKLENVSVALQFLSDQGIRIVNIDSSDIVDCKLKLILGLIWTLILHYSISMPMWDGDDGESPDKGTTPKQRLMHWIQAKVPDLPIGNFTSDWNDGRAVGALVDAVAPGLCPDWQDWNPKDAVQNASEAMGLADDWLNIPQLIKPEEMVDPNIDEMSMMTYLSQYPNAKLKPGAPLRAKTNPNSIPPPRVRAYGPGIEPTGPVVGAPANFTVETFSAGKGNVEVIVEDPKGAKIPADVRFNKDRNLTYAVSYTPKVEGPHKVKIQFAGRAIPKSPYTVSVEGHAGDSTKVTASGPGLQPDGVAINRPTFFDIFTKEAGRGVPEVIILDPQGSKTSVPVKLRQTSPDVWRCEYVSPVVGLHSVNIFFAGKPIPGSPLGVRVSPVSDANKCRAYGRGLQPKGVRVKDDADFKIVTKDAGEGVPEARVIGPGGANLPVKLMKIDATTYHCNYSPVKEGRHVVMVTFGGKEINKSPFEVNVGPYKESAIRVFGPGLHGGVVGYPAKFTVDTNGETGSLGFSIEGPSKAKIDCHDNGDGTADVTYYPTAPGQYSVHINCDDEDIPKSPYMAEILPKVDYDPDKVEVHGPGVHPDGVDRDKPTHFTVDCKKAGKAPLEVAIQDALGRQVPVRLDDKRDGTIQAHYTPTSGSQHNIQVNYGGVGTKKSPYRVSVAAPLNPAMVQAFGPGLDKGIKSNTPTHFNVDCREAGPGELDVTMATPEGRDLPITLTDNEDGTYTVDYVAPQPGNYTVNLNYGGLKVPKSPIKVNVQPHVDVSKIKVDGLEPTAPVNSLQQFRVITQDAGKADVQVAITTPSGNRVKAHIIPTHEGFLVNFTPTELGEYLLGISFGGEPISPQPCRLTCVHGSDPSKVRAKGPGLSHGVVNKPAEFVIDTRGAGQGGLGVTVEGPCEAAINCRDNGDGTCSVAYLPTELGDYGINITFNDQHIPGSPFQALVVQEADLSKIKVSGNGIQPHGLYVDSATDFIVDTRAIAKTKGDDGKVSCTITNPSGGKTEKVITPQADGTLRVSYTPFEEGQHTIDILYDNMPIPGSPFSVNVKRGCDPSKCRAYGPGLEKGFVAKPNQFTVETKGAGTGGLGLAIEGTSEARMTCKDNYNGSCSVEYVPTEPGDYDIAIKFADQHIPGSPFKVQVEKTLDPKEVTAFGPGLDPEKVREGIPAKFMVDTSKAGIAPLDVKLKTDKGTIQKPEIKDVGEGVYEVTYQPPPVGSNVQVGVTYGGQDIAGSPFKVKINPLVEPSKVVLSGPGVAPKLLASFPTEFFVDTLNAGYGDLEIQVLGPDQRPRKVEIQDIGNGKYRASYLPDDCGAYKVNVKYGGKEVPGSPVTVQSQSTGSANQCKIKEGIQRTLAQGEEYCITVDTENAGRGAVTCRIRSTSGSEAVDIDIEDNGDGTVNVYYKVADAGEYTLSIKFGGQPVPEGFYTFVASEQYQEHSSSQKSHRRKRSQQHVVEQRSTSSLQESSSVTTKRSSTQKDSSKHKFRDVELNHIPLPSTGGVVTSEVKMPSGNVDKPEVEDNRDGTVSVKYAPREEGLHEVYIKFNGEHVQGSPFKFHVDSLSSGYVTAYGAGLSHGVCGEPGNFTISTKGAGAGGLSLAVEGPSKAEISCHDNKDGTVSVSYLPTAPGEYKISVKFADKHIKGSPYVAKITGEGRKRNQISVGSSSEVTLPGKVSDEDIRALNASITAPSGLEEPAFLKKLPSGNMCVSFTPRESGAHTVAVKRMGKHIPNSPFKIDVKDREVGDAKKVKISGNALKEGQTHVDNTFSIDTRNAGFGGLSLSMEGPSKAEIQCKDNDDGTLNISYKPTEPGYYIMNLKFADHHVEGSPFTVKVSGEGSNRQREKIQRQREAVPITEVGSQCKLTFKMPGITSFDLAATVTSPGGVTEDAEIKEVEDGLYAVAFVPKELGVHTVSVKYKEMHIPGSPFQFTVGPLRDGGAHRVHAGGPGLERGEQGQPCEFNIWTREAGAGTLAVSVEGPSKAQIDFKDRKDGSCYVSYTASEPGEYRVGIKFNDQHIPDSPHKVYISPAVGDAHKLEVAQFPDSGVQPDKPATFLVRKNDAKGELDAKIVSPSGIEDDCFIQSIDSETYSVRFMARENGIHNIHLKFNGVHIPGSPFRIKVGKVDADPAALHAYGNGLTEIKTGQKTDFIIDTCNAGAGALAVSVDGPSRVAMDCTEVEEGYKVRYTPLVPGDYYISIKYNGYHIVGSPYKVPCTGADLAERGAQETSSVVVETVQKISKSKNVGPVLPLFKSDASKVTSKGMGLKKAYLGKQNQFTVHAGDAGNNILFVGIHGPKGPCEEVYVKHTGRHNYNVSYLVRERGDYIVLVKWGDDHIPGSPYKVEV